MTIRISFVASVLFITYAVVLGQYSPPRAKVEPLLPRGFRISVPHEPGITLVAFHVQFNEDFDALEAGTIAKDIIKTRNGRWSYVDRSKKLKVGDVIYYWVHVVYEGLGYNLLGQEHRVTEFYTLEGGSPQTNNETEQRPCSNSDSKLVDHENGGRTSVCAGQLLLHDPFDVPNDSTWRRVETFTSSPDYAFNCYRNDARNFVFNAGTLSIVPIPTEKEFGDGFIRYGTWALERCTGQWGTRDCRREARGAYILPPVMSGSMDTKNKFAFLYGKVEIRAKLPKGDWIYPIISLEPLETPSSPQPQMRIASSFGNNELHGSNGIEIGNRVLCGGALRTTEGTNEPRTYNARLLADGYKLWSDDYHVYELEWRRDKIISRVDGREYGSTETGTAYDRPFYLRLAVAVGGHDEFPDSLSSGGYDKPWRNVGSKALFDFYNATNLWKSSWSNESTSLKVDYIKVWAL